MDTLVDTIAEVLEKHRDYTPQWDAFLTRQYLTCACFTRVRGSDEYRRHVAAAIAAALAERPIITHTDREAAT